MRKKIYLLPCVFVFVLCLVACDEQMQPDVNNFAITEGINGETEGLITEILESKVNATPELTPTPEVIPTPTPKPTSTPKPSPTPTPTPAVYDKKVLLDTLPDGIGQTATVYVTSVESIDSGTGVNMVMKSVECFDELFVYREPVENWHVLVNWSKQYYYGFRGSFYLTDGTNEIKPQGATYSCALYEVFENRVKHETIYVKDVYEDEFFVIPFDARFTVGNYYLEFVCCQNNQSYSSRIYFSVIGDQPPKPLELVGVHVKEAKNANVHITDIEVVDSGLDVNMKKVKAQVHEDYYHVRDDGSFCLAGSGISGSYEYTRELTEEEKSQIGISGSVYSAHDENNQVSCPLYYVYRGNFAVEFPKNMANGDYIYEFFEGFGNHYMQTKIYFTVK